MILYTTMRETSDQGGGGHNIWHVRVVKSESRNPTLRVKAENTITERFYEQYKS